MMFNKLFYTILLGFIFLFMCVWTFNHINAWVGIGVFIFGIFISPKIINKLKKQK